MAHAKTLHLCVVTATSFLIILCVPEAPFKLIPSDLYLPHYSNQPF